MTNFAPFASLESSDTAVMGWLSSLVCQFIAFSAVNLAVNGLGLFTFALCQWVLVVPLYLAFKDHQRDRAARSLMRTSCLGVVANAACFLVLLFSINIPC